MIKIRYMVTNIPGWGMNNRASENSIFHCLVQQLVRSIEKQHMHILVIEDDQMLRRALSHHLLENGHTVSSAANGKEAVTLIDKHRDVDVVLCDLLMPELSGAGFILTLKKYYPKKLPVIVIVSAVKEVEEFLKKIEISYDHYLAKPVDFEKLDEIMLRVGAEKAA